MKRYLKIQTSLYFIWSLKNPRVYSGRVCILPSFPWPTFPFLGPPCNMVVLSLTASHLPESWLLIAVCDLEAYRWVNYSYVGYILEVTFLILDHPRVLMQWIVTWWMVPRWSKPVNVLLKNSKSRLRPIFLIGKAAIWGLGSWRGTGKADKVFSKCISFVNWNLMITL